MWSIVGFVILLGWFFPRTAGKQCRRDWERFKEGWHSEDYSK